MTIKELLEKRATLVNNARAILDKAKAENREPTADEQRQFDEAMADVDKIKAEVEQQEKAQRRQQWLDDETKALETSRGRLSQTTRADSGQGSTKPEKRSVRIRPGMDLELRGPRAAVEYDAAFRNYLLDAGVECRTTLQQDSDTKGGYLVPEQFIAELIQDLDNVVAMRGRCRIIPLRGAQSIGFPSLDTDIGDPTWTTELGTGSEDTSMAFGKREFKSYPLARRIKVSKTLLRNSGIPVEALVRQRMAYKFGTVMENAYLNGSGAMQPLGLFTASNNGISTTRDVSTGNTNSEIRFDGLINAKYSLKAQYRRNLTWIFHRDAIKQIRKLKDGEGRYIWEPSVRAGDPDSILQVPTIESEYAPNTFSTTLYVGILGDLSQYWIIDSLDMEIQALYELYAESNEVGFIGRYEGDGGPVDQNAFARVKLA